MGHGDVLLVLLSPGHCLSGSGREHGRSIPFSDIKAQQNATIPMSRLLGHAGIMRLIKTDHPVSVDLDQ
jgi:hypothetical protein